MPLPSGTELGRYSISVMIGTGGMGEVYRAFDPHLGRAVAIKVLPREIAHYPEAQRRFERELRAISALNHRSICTVYDTGRHEGQPFIVMELMEGTTLDAELRNGPAGIRRLIDVGIQVAEALAVAHQQGIVHRDIKAANIFLTAGGDVKVLDFGVAKMRHEAAERPEDDTAAVTASGSVLGTVAYMSPEQARGDDVDGRTDIFALGVVMYQMATGSLPFRGDPNSVLVQISSSQPPLPVNTLNPAVPPPICAIIARALEKNIEERYQSAAEIATDLRDYRRELTSGEVLARRTPTLEAMPRWTPRRRVAGVMLVTAGLVVASGAAWLVLQDGRAEIRSIAVVPCSSSDPALQHQCDVLGENLIASLAQTLEVKSLEAVQSYRAGGKPVMEIGRELEVDAILTARLDSGRPSQLVVELTNARNGAHVYGDRFDAPDGRTPGGMNDVALRVADNLTVRLSATERAKLEAYSTYQRAMYYWEQRTSASLLKAIDLLNEAVRAEPTFARAHTGLASAYVLLPYYGGMPPADAYQRGIRSAREALRLDDGQADAHAALGLAMRDHERNWESAEREFRRAIQLNPRSGSALQWYAEYLAMMGRFDDALDRIREAERVMPLSLTVRAVHGWILLCAGRVDDARAKLDETLELDREFPLTRWFLGQLHLNQRNFTASIRELGTAVRLSGGSTRMLADLGSAYGQAGTRDSAVAILGRLRTQSREVPVSRYEFAVVSAGMGDLDQAFEELQAALDEKTWQAVNVQIDPMLVPLRSDRRFEALVRRAGFPSR